MPNRLSSIGLLLDTGKQDTGLTITLLSSHYWPLPYFKVRLPCKLLIQLTSKLDFLVNYWFNWLQYRAFLPLFVTSITATGIAGLLNALFSTIYKKSTTKALPWHYQSLSWWSLVIPLLTSLFSIGRTYTSLAYDGRCMLHARIVRRCHGSSMTISVSLHLKIG